MSSSIVRLGRWATMVVVVVLCLELASARGAEDELRNTIETAARKIETLMKQQQMESVTVKPAKDETTLGATILAGIDLMLKDELKKLVKVVEKGGSLGVQVEVHAAKDQFNPNDRMLRLKFALKDIGGEPLTRFDGDQLVKQSDQNLVKPDSTVLANDGKTLKEKYPLKDGAFDQNLPGGPILLASFGGNSTLFRSKDAKPGEDFPGSLSQLEALMKPTAVILQDSFVKFVPESPLRVAVVSNGQRKRLRMVDGHPFVDFEVGEKFTLELHNDSDQPVAAEFLLDGINTFYFNKAAKEFRHWIVAGSTAQQKSALTLQGWYTERGVADPFIATTFSQSKRKELGLTETPVGAITIVFSSAIPKDSDAATTNFVLQKYSVPSEAGGTREITRQVAVLQTKTVQKTIYIGGTGERVQQVEGDPSKLKADSPFGVLTIRYRHPAAD